MTTASPLGDFLRARRAQVSPSSVGLGELPGRRVSGLRREEVAALAGISTAYYVRLEQGRERSPSRSVVAALARALRLGADGAAHLRALTGTRPPTPGTDRGAAPGLLSLMARWSDTPALVLSAHLDVLAASASGELLFPGLVERGPGSAARGNMLDYLFTDPRARELHTDWAAAAGYSVAAVRARAVAGPDPRLVELVGRLSVASPEFARQWARHDVRHKTHRRLGLRHPLVGELSVDYETFTVSAEPSQSLLVYQPDPDDAAAAAALARLAAPADRLDSTTPDPGAAGTAG